MICHSEWEVPFVSLAGMKDYCGYIIDSIKSGKTYLANLVLPKATRLASLADVLLGYAFRYPIHAFFSLGLLGVRLLLLFLPMPRFIRVHCHTIAIAVMFHFIGMHSRKNVAICV